MDLVQWMNLVSATGADVRGIDPRWLESRFTAGDSPVVAARSILSGLAPKLPPPAPIPVAPVNTGLGYCPQCKGTNIEQFDEFDSGNSGQKTTAGLLGLLCLWPMLLLIPFVGNKRKIGTSRSCRACGFRWPV